MAPINTQVSQKVMPDGSIHWMVTIGSKTSEFVLIGPNPLSLGGATVTLPGGKAIAGISSTGLITYTDSSAPTQLVLTAGKNGRGIASVTKPNANTARIAFDDGTPPVDLPLPPGQDSTVPGPSNYARALALGIIPAGTTEAQYLASLKGSSPKPGLVQAATTLTKGALHYNTGTQNLPVKPSTHELALNSAATTDKDGDLIAVGTPVNVTGLGFLPGRLYYVTAPDGNGRNLSPLTLPVDSSVLSTATQSLFVLGRAYTVGNQTYLSNTLDASIDPAAAASYLNVYTTDGPLPAEYASGSAFFASQNAVVAVSGGALKPSATSGPDAIKYLSAGIIDNPIIQADLTRGGGFGARYAINGTGYTLLLQGAGGDAGKIILSKMVVGNVDAELYKKGTTVTSGTYRLEFNGPTIKLYENGALLTTVTDSTYITGYAFAYLQAVVGASVDNLKVTPPPGNIT